MNRITNEKHSVFCQQESRSVSEFIFFFLPYCLHYFIVINYLDYRHHYDDSNKRILAISILRTRYFQLALVANNSAHCSIQLATATPFLSSAALCACAAVSRSKSAVLVRRLFTSATGVAVVLLTAVS